MSKFSVSASALATVASMVFFSSPALAHNGLISQSPSGESVVAAGSIQIRLDFEEEPLATEFGQGNLIAIADATTLEQLGPACAGIDGRSLYTTVNIQKAGTYKVLWRSPSDDGHVASGEYQITVENNTGYQTDRVGNQCFDDNGVELLQSSQELLSKKADESAAVIQGLLWGALFVGLGGVLGSAMVRRQRSKSNQPS
jgi:methionine-rich copper-binding protein CopC